MTRLVDVECMVTHITEKGVAVVLDEHDDWTWLSKSQVELYPATPNAGDMVIITMPEWLAFDKGLI